MNEKHLEDLLKSGKKYLRPKDKSRFRLAVLENQNYLCKMCDKNLSDEKNTNRAVDHNHKTKLCRGVLCATCNMVLGKIERAGYSGAWLSRAKDYIESDSYCIVYPEKITARRKTKKAEMRQLIKDNAW